MGLTCALLGLFGVALGIMLMLVIASLAHEVSRRNKKNKD